MSGYYNSDLPQDLSAKFKTVGVQTDDHTSSSCVEAVHDILTGLSEKQTRMLLGVITSVLFRNSEETNQKSNQYESSVTALRKHRESLGWTSLEPETPPISPPHQNLLQLSAVKTGLTVTQFHDSYLVSKPDEHHQASPGCSSVKCEAETSMSEVHLVSRTLSEEEAREGFTCLSRDEKLVMEMNIPFTVEDIINKPMEEFNDILSKHSVSEEIINICRDIRRRGKNKIAAQNCRKRKVDQIFSLEEDLAMVRNRKKNVLSNRAELLRQKQEVGGRLFSLERRILSAVGKPDHTWKLSIDEKNGKVAFVEHVISKMS